MNCKLLLQIPVIYLRRDFFIMASEYRNIGKIVAAHGLLGEVILEHHLGKKTSLKGLDTIFLEEKKNEMIPWFIRSARIKSDTEIFISLEGIDQREAAKKLLQKEVWLEAGNFAKYATGTAPISLVGFEMIHDGKLLGEILEVIEQPLQVLCRIELNGKDALIPLHAETLEKVDKKKKQVHVILPEGLLDIYS